MHHLIYDMRFDTSRKRFIHQNLLYNFFSKKRLLVNTNRSYYIVLF